MYVCIYMYMYACICIYMYTRPFTHTRHTDMYPCTHERMRRAYGTPYIHTYMLIARTQTHTAQQKPSLILGDFASHIFSKMRPQTAERYKKRFLVGHGLCETFGARGGGWAGEGYVHYLCKYSVSSLIHNCDPRQTQPLNPARVCPRCESVPQQRPTHHREIRHGNRQCECFKVYRMKVEVGIGVGSKHSCGQWMVQ